MMRISLGFEGLIEARWFHVCEAESRELAAQGRDGCKWWKGEQRIYMKYYVGVGTG